jgi:hypothetical protein
MIAGIVRLHLLPCHCQSNQVTPLNAYLSIHHYLSNLTGLTISAMYTICFQRELAVTRRSSSSTDVGGRQEVWEAGRITYTQGIAPTLLH